MRKSSRCFEEGRILTCRRSCSDAAKAASHLNRKTTALKYAGKEVDIQRYCVGDDHPDYQRALQKLDEIKQKLST